MTPQEKAVELTGKFSLLVTTWDCYNDIPIPDDEILVDTKKCALICLDEILNGFRKLLPSSRKYWEEVKLEIEKL